MLSNHTEDIITAIKAKPNSLWKNKALSHAHDMLASLRMLEMEESSHDVSNGRTEPYNASNDLEQKLDREFHTPNACACPEGGIDRNCPIHGDGVRR